MSVPRPAIVLVTPARSVDNNGNWQTAARWARMLGDRFRMQVVDRWQPEQKAQLMIALHARRSAPSISAWRDAHPRAPLVVVLTGTDLYRDIAADADAQRSLALADRLVVLNERGLDALPVPLRAKGLVCLQSCPARPPRPRPHRHLRAVMVGHLRVEKDPRTYFAAARLLAHRADIRLDHVGGALDASLADEARALAAECPGYRWLGALPHGATLARIASAHLLVQPSRMEGGAHAVIEAIRCGTTVLASRIDGNVGLLGDDYDGCFAPGDASALASLLQRARDDAALLPHLSAQCAARAPLFDPARERDTLHGLVGALLA